MFDIILIVVNMQNCVRIQLFSLSFSCVRQQELSSTNYGNQTAMKNELLGWSFLLACARENYPRKVFPLRAPLCGKQRWFDHVTQPTYQNWIQKVNIKVNIMLTIWKRYMILASLDCTVYFLKCICINI